MKIIIVFYYIIHILRKSKIDEIALYSFAIYT